MELEFDDMMMQHPTDRSESEYTKEKDGVTVTETYQDYANRWRGYVEGMQNAPVYYGRGGKYTAKPRVVVLGSGWAAMSFIKSLSKRGDCPLFF